MRAFLVLCLLFPAVAAYAQCDSDGDTHQSPSCGGADCDDTEATVYPGAVELCDGVDTDCDGDTLGGGVSDTQTYSTTSQITSGATYRSRGGIYRIDQATRIHNFAVQLNGSVGASVDFAVYEATTLGGTYTRVWSSGTQQLASSGYAWHTSPDIDFDVTPGRYYAVLVGWSSASISYYYSSAPAWPSYSWGSLQAGQASTSVYLGNIGATATGMNTTTAYPVRITLQGSSEVDYDGDGWLGCEDCDDDDPAVVPTPEICNALDDDCDGVLPADEADGDADGESLCDGDCDDADPARATTRPEACDGVDNDCDAVVPPGETSDADGDGAVTCADCDDADSDRAPNLVEACDGVDNDCDGSTANVGPTYQSPSTNSASLTGPDRFRGGIFRPSVSTPVARVGAYLDAPPGETLRWVVYSSSSLTGTYTRQFVGTTAAVGGARWEQSGPVGMTLAANTYYAIGVSWDTGDVVYYYNNSATFPRNTGWGEHFRGASYSGWGSAPPSTSSITNSTTSDYFVSVTVAGDDDEVDADGDGFLACAECDDTDAGLFPGGAEACDGLDTDCDGALLPTELDDDGDGDFTCAGDCDDNDGTVGPGQPELCDGADNDCNSVTPSDEVDGDGDSFLACEECDDTDATVSPVADELCDGVDTDCDGTIGVPGTGSTYSVLPTVNSGSASAYYRGGIFRADQAATIATIGSYLGPSTTQTVTWTIYESTASSGPWTMQWSGTNTAAAGAASIRTSPSVGYTMTPGRYYAIGVYWTGSATYTWESRTFPLSTSWGAHVAGAYDSAWSPVPETSPGIITTTSTAYAVRVTTTAGLSEADADNDGAPACDDCDDGDAARHPGATEICDGEDDDCDGAVPLNEQDGDGDGESQCEGDCDVADGTRYTGAPELCDGEDNDCDGVVPANESDGDGDGAPGCDDCDDTDDTISPDLPEICDGVDNDCDGTVGGGAGGVYTTGGVLSSGTSQDLFRGSVITVTQATTLTKIEAFLASPSGTTVYWLVYEATSPTGTYSRIHQSSAYVSATTADWRASGTLNVPLVAGRTYAIGVSWISDATYYWTTGVTTNPPFGTILGGAADSSSFSGTPPLSIPAPTTTNRYGIRLTTGGDPETDGDGDGALACADCNDSSATVHPGASEACNGVDDDCNGAVPTNEADADGDGSRVCAGDCDDTSATRRPGATETCNGLDDNCDTVVPTNESDGDGDGSPGCADCNDANPAVRPGATEACNGQDDNCDNVVPSNELDADGDTFSVCEGDCADSSATRYPGATEACNGLDDDCNFVVPIIEADSDGDGTRVCGGDCDDAAPTVEPGAPELCDGLDNNCDNAVPPNEADADGDGSRVCAGDCDDTTASRRPGAAEQCNGVDDDCNNAVPSNEADGDGDGERICEGDCADGDAARNTSAAEACNGVDDDCNGAPDADAAHEVDADGDGSRSCEDCDDGDADQTPGATEACDGLDNDCNGSPDADAGGEADVDADGFLSCDECDDDEPTAFPGNPEVCDGIDNDCNLKTDEDGDGDGDGVSLCDGDCDEEDPANFPGNEEVCDGQDNDCDPLSDENGDRDLDFWTICTGDCDDEEPNTFPDAPELCDQQDNSCDGSLPAAERDEDADGMAPCEGDCDDADPDIYEGAPEVCDGVDNNCNDSIEDENVDGDGDGSSPCEGDCDDTDDGILPGADEGCDGVDTDCDGEIPDEEADLDGDGVSECAGDCDDDDPLAVPGGQENDAETCDDNIDNDCDGDEDTQDADCEGVDIGGDDDDDGGGGGGRGTGCRCDQSEPRAWAPLALLVTLLGRRRRR